MPRDFPLLQDWKGLSFSLGAQAGGSSSSKQLSHKHFLPQLPKSLRALAAQARADPTCHISALLITTQKKSWGGGRGREEKFCIIPFLHGGSLIGNSEGNLGLSCLIIFLLIKTT